MKAIITVPQPCHENWDAMQPNQLGRHCGHCALTVVDFTNWTLPDIAQYLKKHTGKRVCGLFLDTQLHQPFDLKIFAPKIISWHTQPFRKIAALIIVCFALATASCNDEVITSGEPMINAPAAFMDDRTKTDTLAVIGGLSEPRSAGKDSIVIRSGVNKTKKRSTRRAEEGFNPDIQTTMGIPELPEPPYTSPVVRQSPEFQPHTGPPEYDSTQTE